MPIGKRLAREIINKKYKELRQKRPELTKMEIYQKVADALGIKKRAVRYHVKEKYRDRTLPLRTRAAIEKRQEAKLINALVDVMNSQARYGTLLGIPEIQKILREKGIRRVDMALGGTSEKHARLGSVGRYPKILEPVFVGERPSQRELSAFATEKTIKKDDTRKAFWKVQRLHLALLKDPQFKSFSLVERDKMVANIVGLTPKTIALLRTGLGSYSKFKKYVPPELIGERGGKGKLKEEKELKARTQYELSKIPDKQIDGMDLKYACSILLGPAGPVWFSLAENKRRAAELLRIKRNLPTAVQKRIDEIIERTRKKAAEDERATNDF